MRDRFVERAALILAMVGTVALGGCVIAPYPPHYAYGYGPGYYHPHYWWR